MSDEPVRVLVVDDEPGFADLVATRLERQCDRFDASPATNALEGLPLLGEEFERAVVGESPDEDVLPGVDRPEGDDDSGTVPATEPFDAIVSDYDMPRMDGLEFLDVVRTVAPDLPFVLYTGKGSEELASEAISRGVTDYLQKGNGPDRYARLANRIEHAVGRRRAERALETERALLDAAIDRLADVFYIFGEDGRLIRWNDRLAEVTGYSSAELDGMTPAQLVAPEDRDRIDSVGDRELADRDRTAEARLLTRDGERIPYEFHSAEIATADGRSRGRVGIGRELTDRRRLEARNDRLSQFAGTLSHDVKSSLTVARGRLSLLAEHVSDDEAGEHLESARQAIDRVGTVVEDVADLAEVDDLGDDLSATDLASVVDAAWEGVAVRAADASLHVEPLPEIWADRSTLRRLLSNLLNNAVEHADGSVDVRVGALDDGFYVADDGPGVPDSDRDRVFDWRFTTKAGGSGIGLASVRRIAEAHGWTVAIDDSAAGGARIEVRDVETV